MRQVVILALVILTTYSCVQNPQKTAQTIEKELLLKQYLDSFLIKNSACLNNEITEKECSNLLKNEFISKNLGDSINCISELAMNFERLMEYNENKYVVKFSIGESINNFKLSDNYQVTFQVLSIVDKETAIKLKEGAQYYIKGSCYNYASKKSFVLPSGRYFEGYPSIMKIKEKPYIDLGTFIVKNISFVEVESDKL